MDSDFRITYFLDNGVLGKAADLDSAIAFMGSRNDPKVGPWDLARDTGLRESLLPPEKPEAARSAPTKIPAKLKEATTKAKTGRAKKVQSEKDGRQHVHRVLWPPLESRGWRASWDGKTVGKSYILPMAKWARWSEFFGPAPLLYCELAVSKKQSVLRFKNPSFIFSAMSDFLSEHADGFERITGQPPSKNVICRSERRGWSNESEDWEQILPSVDALLEFLKPKMYSLSTKAEEAFAAHKAKYPGLQSLSDGTPSVLGIVKDM